MSYKEQLTNGYSEHRCPDCSELFWAKTGFTGNSSKCNDCHNADQPFKKDLPWHRRLTDEELAERLKEADLRKFLTDTEPQPEPKEDLDRLRMNLKNSLLKADMAPSKFAANAGFSHPTSVYAFLKGENKKRTAKKVVERIKAELERMCREQAEPQPELLKPDESTLDVKEESEPSEESYPKQLIRNEIARIDRDINRLKNEVKKLDAEISSLKHSRKVLHVCFSKLQ